MGWRLTLASLALCCLWAAVECARATDDQVKPAGDAAGIAATQPATTRPASADAPSPIWGVYVGNDVKYVTQYEQWLGRPTDAILGYTGDAQWADYDGCIGWAMGVWAPANRRVLWSVALMPRNATLADAARGLYNSHYRRAAEMLAKWHPDEPVIYIRTGWEFNGGWFHYNSVCQPQNFIGAWRQFVTTFRAASPRFRFDWCPAGCDWFPGTENAYPGDEYVDVIGLDVYDQLKWKKIADPAERWQKLYLNGPYGLVWHRDFAKKHNKPMSYPEWGSGGNDAGDNPYFIEHMHQWFLDNHVIYATYWNSNSAYKGQLSKDAYPNAGALFKQLFVH